MEWFKMRLIWGPSIEHLSDAEAGRFIKAVFAYVKRREEYHGNGKEEATVYQALETLREDLEKYDAEEARRQEKERQISEKRRAAINKRWGKQTNTNEYKPIQNDTFVSGCNGLYSNERQNQKDIILNNNNNNARGDGPFGLDDLEITEALRRDEQIENAARSIGLTVSEGAMIKARGLAREYGLDKLMDAIQKSVDVPKWAYVEAILKGGGRNERGRPDPGGHAAGGTGAGGKYASLFDPAPV